MIWEIGPRRWRLGLFLGTLDLGSCPGVAPGWYGPGLWPAPLDGPAHFHGIMRGYVSAATRLKRADGASEVSCVRSGG